MQKQEHEQELVGLALESMEQLEVGEPESEPHESVGEVVAAGVQELIADDLIYTLSDCMCARHAMFCSDGPP